jgi:hypothetical protein
MSIPDPVITGVVTGSVVTALQQAAKQGQDFIAAALGHPGESLGAILGNLVFDRRLENAAIVGNRARLIQLNIGIETPKEAPLNVLHPLLEGASLEEQAEMQERWANMLANACDPRRSGNVLGSFARILTNLTPRHVKFLDALFERSNRNPWNPEMTDDELRKIYYEAGLARSLALFARTQNEIDKDPEAYRQDSEDYAITLDILKRESLLSEVSYTTKRESPLYDSSERFPLQRRYLLSALGEKFVAACQPPPSKI